MRIGRIGVIVAAGVMGVSLAAQNQERPGPLPQFRGQYAVSGIAGSVRVADALGGSYTEWAVNVGQPPHEVRMMVGPRRGDGTFPVWRFEQDPAPNVANEGSARLEDQTLIADFYSSSQPQKLLRERWTLGSNGSLRFDLEAAQGGAPQRVGGFTANRQ
jgi:hypothetical protein